MQVDLDDVVYLLGDLWGGRSASAAAGDRDAIAAEASRANAGKNFTKKGTWRDLRPLCLVRRAPLAPARPILFSALPLPDFCDPLCALYAPVLVPHFSV